MPTGDHVVEAVYRINPQPWVYGGAESSVFDFLKPWILPDGRLFFWGNGVENAAGYLVSKAYHRVRSRRFKNSSFVSIAIAVLYELRSFRFIARIYMTTGYGVINANDCFHG